MEKYMQVGNFVLRSPSGEFLPSVPLFILEADAGTKNPINGLSIAEEITRLDVARLFSSKIKTYKKRQNKSKAKAGKEGN